jgi:hypothetical protein
MAAALLAWTPTLAAGSSLLSGYGGPGQGSQAIIGSTLVGGAGAGGAGGSAGGGADGSSNSPHDGEQPAGTTGSSSGGAAGAHGDSARKSAGGSSGSRQTGAGHASPAGVGTYPAVPAEQASDTGVSRAETLGLSGGDLLYILLALAVLAFTGVLTRKLARTNGPDENDR